MLLWWLLKTSCAVFIRIKQFFTFITFNVAQYFQKETTIGFKSSYYYTIENEKLTPLEASTFDFKSGFILRWCNDIGKIQIIRDSIGLHKTPVECEYTFPIFYVNHNKMPTLNKYLLEDNVLDKAFLSYISKRKLEDDDEILFVDNNLVTKCMLLTNEIVIGKTTYTIQERKS